MGEDDVGTGQRQSRRKRKWRIGGRATPCGIDYLRESIIPEFPD